MWAEPENLCALLCGRPDLNPHPFSFLCAHQQTHTPSAAEPYANGFFMNVDAGGEETVLKKLQDIQNVKDAYSVYGIYDNVERIEAETMDKLKEVVTWRVRTET